MPPAHQPGFADAHRVLWSGVAYVTALALAGLTNTRVCMLESRKRSPARHVRPLMMPLWGDETEQNLLPVVLHENPPGDALSKRDDGASLITTAEAPITPREPSSSSGAPPSLEQRNYKSDLLPLVWIGTDPRTEFFCVFIQRTKATDPLLMATLT
jgi:hypothetical protein